MLPSNNFFKHIFCPYDKAKLCHRPYCHYKHAETVSGPVEDSEYLFNSNHTANAYSTYTPSSIDNDHGSGGYTPMPVTKPSGILKSNSSSYSSNTMVIPEYNPTPISWLKEHNSSSGNIYDPSKYDPPSYKMPDARKKKNTEEYDPTQVKLQNTSKKRVVFADEAGIPLEDADSFTPGFSSSEEDVDDSGSAPKFSDDDLDDYSQAKADDWEQAPKPKDKEDGDLEQEEEDIPDEESIDEFSLVDKILVSSKKSDKFIKNFKKSVLEPKEKKTKSVKSDKKPVESKKQKTKDIDKVQNSKPKKVSDFDAIMSLAAFDDLKDNDSMDDDSFSKKMSSKTNELSSTKSSSNLETNKDKSGLNKSNTSTADKKAEESSHSSKHSDKKDDSKSKHKKHDSSDKSKTKSDSNEKLKSSSSKTDKSAKSDKNKSSGHSSSKTDKSVSKTGKKDQSSSHKSSKSSKEREAKLQDEQVTSSSIAKKNKNDPSMKHSSKEAHSESNKSSSLKSKSGSSKESTSLHKRKIDSSDDESSKSKAKKSRNDISDDDDDDMRSVDGGVEEIIDLTSESEEDTEEQCKRIFEESFVANDEVVYEVIDKEESSSTSRPHIIDVTASKKQRLAHAAATSLKKPGFGVKKASFRPTSHPGQVMLDRYAKIRAAQAELNESKERGSNTNSPGRGKTRISIAPNHSLLAALAEKNRMAQSSNSFSPLPSTVSKTLKVTKRVAHIPDVAVKSRPVIPIDYGSKVPTIVRQKFLNAFIDEHLKLAASEDEAYESALEEEKAAYGRSSSKAIYVNVASNTLNRLRRRVTESTDLAAAKKSEMVSSTTSSKKTVSHETVLNGPMAQRTSFSIERKKPAPVQELKGIALYDHLSTYVLNEEQLKENGYPFPHPVELGKAVIEGIYANRTQYCNDPFKRTCSRCNKIYYVNLDGDYVRDEECEFHWGRLFKRRIAGAIESRYTCCQGDSESDGCCVGTGHVFEGSEAHAMKGYVSTLPKTPPPDKYYGIYALDCEMCYTTAGIELTRISVIGPDLKPVYETFVKPQNKVLDFNTRFSGITEENLKNVRTTIRDVQAVLLCMFNSRTILIGHSLESDFKALKLFHKTVVDTSVVFPHKLGLPFKRALRNLSSEKLNKIIQNDVGGHDSVEDAVACMELMIYKIKEDLKANRLYKM
ncbi:hypothetical protein JTE90_005274 [Oedothorax gibbosus]|uniref:Exonuclease domain-containing protein n=1 Tax=Oedothorax gibbosus TaxID=931172 RepID=A0AAV6U3T0_9ARAC|nr:hypothetical protein JTE90_005274 [Oedothorax gibbosus]